MNRLTYMLESVVRDLTFGLRASTRNLGVTLVIVLTSCIGVSASSTVFCWIQSMVREPLPSVANSDELLSLALESDSGEPFNLSYRDYQDVRAQSHGLAGVTVYSTRALSSEVSGAVKRVWSMLVSDDFFSVLKLAPALGRFFSADDHVNTQGGRRVAVISHDYWRSAWGSDPHVIGKTLQLNRQPYTIIGVAPRDFRGTITGLSFDIWAPIVQQDALTGGDGAWIENRRHRALQAMARRAPGQDLAAAQRDLDVVSARLAREYPDENRGLSLRAFALADSPYGAQSVLGKMFGVLLLASLLVLSIVGANLTNILLVRASERERELGTRLALGASRARIIGQLLVEAAVPSLAGALLSVLLTVWWAGSLGKLIPVTNLPLHLAPHVGPEVIAYAFTLSLLLGLVTGLLPALRVSSEALGSTLNDGSRGSSSGPTRQRLRVALTTAQVSLAFVTLVGAGLLVESFDRLSKVNPGFAVDDVALVSLAATGPGQSAEQMAQYYERAAESVRRLPGVRSVGLAEFVPLGFKGGSWEELEVEGYAPATGENMKVYRNLVSASYFDALRIPLSSGRAFTPLDDRTRPDVAIVNDTFAKHYFHGREAVGRKLEGWGRTLTIVGVVRDAKYASFTESPQPYLYVPYRQFAGADSDAVLHIAHQGAAGPILAQAQRDLAELGSTGYVVWSMPLHDYVAASLFKNRLAALLLGLLGVVSLLLAALGIYGVTSHGVRQRHHELGIRMALGASARDVLALVMGQAARVAALGVLIGCVLSLFGVRVLSSLLYGVESVSPPILLAVATLLMLVALLGSLVPALRAARVDPAVVLRSR